MPTTHAQGRGQSRAAPASVSASASRNMASATRGPVTRARASQQAAANRQTTPSRGQDDSDDEDGDGGEDESSGDEESSDEGEDQAAVQVAPRRLNVPELLSVFDPNLSTPAEFLAGRQGSELTRSLASTLATHFVRNETDVNRLRAAVPPARWSAQLAENMHRRYLGILQRLHDDVARPGQGNGVIRTIQNLRQLFTAIDDLVRSDISQNIDVSARRSFGTLLVTILRYLLTNDNRDLYQNRSTVAYAGQAFQSEHRLVSSFVSPRSEPNRFLDVVSRFTPYLRHEAGNLHQLYVTAHQRASQAGGFEGASAQERANLGNLVVVLRGIVQRVSSPPPT